MSGQYLGEVVYQNRLMYNLNSPYRSTNFGNYGNYGNVGNYYFYQTKHVMILEQTLTNKDIVINGVCVRINYRDALYN